MFEELRNAAGERLEADFTPAPAAGEGAPLVVIGHGVTANKDRPWAVALAAGLAAAGIASLRFSFSGNGGSEGDFRASCPTKEAADLGAVLDACGGRPVTYVGHSMGGAVGVLRASRDPRITRLVSLAGMVDTADFARRKFGALTPGVDVMWDKPECPLSATFQLDMQAIGSVLEQGAAIEVPWLLLHGDADTVVPIEDSRAISAVGQRAQLIEVAGADHLFGGEHERTMAERVVHWLQGQLAE